MENELIYDLSSPCHERKITSDLFNYIPQLNLATGTELVCKRSVFPKILWPLRHQIKNLFMTENTFLNFISVILFLETQKRSFLLNLMDYSNPVEPNKISKQYYKYILLEAYNLIYKKHINFSWIITNQCIPGKKSKGKKCDLMRHCKSKFCLCSFVLPPLLPANQPGTLIAMEFCARAPCTKQLPDTHIQGM